MKIIMRFNMIDYLACALTPKGVLNTEGKVHQKSNIMYTL